MGETNIFKVLADSQRRDILIMLRNERLNAGEIAEVSKRDCIHFTEEGHAALGKAVAEKVRELFQ